MEDMERENVELKEINESLVRWNKELVFAISEALYHVSFASHNLAQNIKSGGESVNNAEILADMADCIGVLAEKVKEGHAI